MFFITRHLSHSQSQFSSYPSISHKKFSYTQCWKYSLVSFVSSVSVYLSLSSSWNCSLFSLSPTPSLFCSPLSSMRWTYQMPALQSPAQRMSTTASQWVHLSHLSTFAPNTHRHTNVSLEVPATEAYKETHRYWSVNMVRNIMDNGIH